MKTESEGGVPDERKREGPKVLRTVYVRRVVEREGVSKCLTVIHLICACNGGGYRNAPFGVEVLVARC